MRKILVAVLLFFCAVLVAVYLIAERAAPKMIDVDPAKVQYHR